MQFRRAAPMPFMRQEQRIAVVVAQMQRALPDIGLQHDELCHCGGQFAGLVLCAGFPAVRRQLAGGIDAIEVGIGEELVHQLAHNGGGHCRILLIEDVLAVEGVVDAGDDECHGAVSSVVFAGDPLSNYCEIRSRPCFLFCHLLFPCNHLGIATIALVCFRAV